MKDKSFTISLLSGKNFRLAPRGVSYWQKVARFNEKYFFNKVRGESKLPKTASCCDIKQFSDELLLEKYLRTHEPSFMGELYRRYAHLVLGTCIKYLKNEARAQDAVSEIFTKLVQKLQTFKPTYFAGWLYKVSRNHCLEILRKDQSRPVFEAFDTIQDFDAIGEEEEPDFLRRELVADALGRALQKIPNCQQVCIDLFYLRGMSYKQVSEKTGYTLKEVKSYVQNGKRNLRNQLADSAAEYGWKKTV